MLDAFHLEAIFYVNHESYAILKLHLTKMSIYAAHAPGAPFPIYSAFLACNQKFDVNV